MKTEKNHRFFKFLKLAVSTRTILFLVMALISLYAASAACPDQRACQNQDGDFYCSPDDTSCEYRHFIQTLSCDVDTSFIDTDTDSDSWTDNCDALPDDRLEWFDMDGDGFGHVYDCDDFDSAIGEDCDPDGDGETNEQEHNGGTNPNINNDLGGGSSKKTTTACAGKWDCSEWSDAKNNCGTRTCASTNGCSNDRPSESQACPEYRTVKYDTQGTNEPEVVPEPEITIEEKEEAPEEDNSGNRLTGQVFNTEPGNFKPASLWLLLIIVAGILGFFFWKRKKKEQQLYSF